LTDATWELLWLTLHHPEDAANLSKTIDYEWIRTDLPAGSLLSRYLAELREGLIESPGQIESILETTEERELLANIYARDLDVEEPRKHIEFCLERLRRNHVEAQIKILEQAILNAPADRQIDLMRERKALLSGLKHPVRLR
jgi:hypothetical protein